MKFKRIIKKSNFYYFKINVEYTVVRWAPKGYTEKVTW